MRKLSPCLLICLALLLTLGFTACESTPKESATAPDVSPQSVLTNMMERAKDITSVAGNFDVSVAMEVDASQVPEEIATLLGKPIAISGSFAQAQEARSFESALALSMAGEQMEVGLKGLEDKFWVKALDQWYEAPAETMQGSQLSYDKQQGEKILALMSELGVDPVTWFPDLKLTKEKLGNESTYHLSTHPDVTKMVTDALRLMQSKEFMTLIDPSGLATGAAGTEEALVPGPEEIQEVQGMVTKVLRDTSLDVWVAAEGYELRKALVKGRVVPPPDEAQGLQAINLTANVLLDKYDLAVKVEAPASALPFLELQKAMQDNPEQFFGPFQSLMTGGGLPSF